MQPTKEEELTLQTTARQSLFQLPSGTADVKTPQMEDEAPEEDAGVGSMPHSRAPATVFRRLYNNPMSSSADADSKYSLSRLLNEFLWSCLLFSALQCRWRGRNKKWCQQRGGCANKDARDGDDDDRVSEGDGGGSCWSLLQMFKHLLFRQRPRSRRKEVVKEAEEEYEKIVLPRGRLLQRTTHPHHPSSRAIRRCAVSDVLYYFFLLPLVLVLATCMSSDMSGSVHGRTILNTGNPDAKRLYDDLLSNYNKLVRPVVNTTDPLTVRIKLKLSQLIDVVSKQTLFVVRLRLCRVRRGEGKHKQLDISWGL
jgi:hypothetical protein